MSYYSSWNLFQLSSRIAYNAVGLSLGFVAKKENFAFEIGFSLLGWGTGLNIEVFHVAGCIWHNMGLDVGGLRATRAQTSLHIRAD